MAKVIVGMSGGVDSSVSAALLKRAGHDVVGVTLNVWPDLPNMPDIQREDACCALGAVEDARRVADKLDIPYYVLNFREVFEDTVIKDFVTTYASGRTPNPCIRCNQFIKFDALLVKARQLGAEYVATGHYARIEHGTPNRLRKAADPGKDQSYVLYVMSQDRLGSAVAQYYRFNPVGYFVWWGLMGGVLGGIGSGLWLMRPRWSRAAVTA